MSAARTRSRMLRQALIEYLPPACNPARPIRRLVADQKRFAQVLQVKIGATVDFDDPFDQWLETRQRPYALLDTGRCPVEAPCRPREQGRRPTVLYGVRRMGQARHEPARFG